MLEITTFITALSSCFTALATFITILEMKWQRENSYKPVLVFDFISVKVKKKNEKILLNENESFHPAIQLRNIGNGVATDISIKWVVDYTSIINTIKQLNKNDKIKIDDADSYFSIESCAPEFVKKFSGTKTVNTEILRIVETKNIFSEMSIPSLFCNCISVLLFLLRDLLISGRPSKSVIAKLKEKMPVKIVMTYRDMQNKIWKKNMALFLDFNFIATHLENGICETDCLTGNIKII